MRRVLITGGTGQLGFELLRQIWPDDVQLVSPPRHQLDMANKQSIDATIESGHWDCVINSAAYTAVDAAEDDPEAAFLANCQGPACLAEATARASIPLIHISTDYVFPGDKVEPYSEGDPVAPVGIYGDSKAAGEREVQKANVRSVVLRTAWILSTHRANFLKTMLRLAARNEPVSVVADQRGCPTSAADIAAALTVVADRLMSDPSSPTGIYHFVNSGDASWWELAIEIFRLSAERGGPSVDVAAISTADYPTRARRPANSRLSSSRITTDFGIKPRNWREAVADIIAELDRTNQLREFA